MAILAITLSGCGGAPTSYANEEDEDDVALRSPLPPLKLDETLVKPKEPVIYGRVVINGKPAEKGSVKVIAVSNEALKDPLVKAEAMPGGVRRNVAPKKHNLRLVSSDVLNDDGLYLIKGLQPGKYKLYCKFGPAFEGKDEETLASYGTAVVSPWSVNKIKGGQQMQDIVMQIREAKEKK